MLNRSHLESWLSALVLDNTIDAGSTNAWFNQLEQRGSPELGHSNARKAGVFPRVAPQAGSDIGSRNAGRERPEGPVDPRRPAWYARYRICGAICGAVSGGGQAGRMAAPIPDVGVGTVGDDDGGS